MVPSVVILLEALPLTANGKVDRRALPTPEFSRTQLSGEFVAPRTPIEEILTHMWSKVLGVEKVGVYDNFFELGGHSLLATQLFSRLRDTFGVQLPIRELFTSPTVAGLGECIERARRNEQQWQIPPLVPVERGTNLPLSYAQTRLWFLDQLESGNFAYNIPTGVRLTGQLNMAALEHSLNEIVRRHEALRTTFTKVDGEPVQVIVPSASFSLVVVNLQELPSQQQQAEVERLQEKEATEPFKLSNGSLLRAKVVELGEKEHVLLLTMHHIVSDGWSIGIVLRELATLYNAYSQGKSSPLPELPIQYADFAIWQRQWLVGEVLKAQLNYWKQHLANAPSLLELPTDRPRPRLQTFRGGTAFVSIGESVTQQLRNLSQRFGVTLFMTLLAAFQTLLYRYTGTEDICVGTPIANRNHSQTEGLIGFFVNTLVLRTNLGDNPSFTQLLQRVREVALGAYAHQDLPFEQLVEALQPERSLSHHPLFQVMFVLQNAPMPAMELPGLSFTPLESNSTTAKFDLTLSMEDTPQGLLGALEYNTDLFDAQTIERILENFQTLLDGIVANPQQTLQQLPVLTAAQRQQLLFEWNQTQQDYPRQDECIHQLFETQVEKTPDAVAVVFENEQLTYSQLNQRANCTAHYLQSLGVRGNTVVGVCLERSVEMVVAVLGILKAGGAYLPLDPAYPSERLAYMLSDGQVGVLLTHPLTSAKLPPHQCRIVDLERDWSVIAQHSHLNPRPVVGSNHLAYVIYTSGSTGKPKGVMIPHGAICNHMLWMQSQFPFTATDCVLQKTPFSFDASVWEFYAPLLSGGVLVMAQPLGHQDPHYLADVIQSQQITNLQLVPSLLQVLLAEKSFADCSSLERVFCGGEALSYSLVERLLGQLNLTVHHLYGPTETCIDATFYSCNCEGETSSLVPIGRPIANTQVYILDSDVQPVPIGVKGELYIGGAGLAMGYLGRPDLTAEKFLPHPFSQQPGHRLYKTGDLVRYRGDGNIEYLGRSDHQLKLRGFRIEIPEIEAVLATHPALQEAVVMVREDVPGDQRLVAYVVFHHASEHGFLSSEPKDSSPYSPTPLATTEGTSATQWLLPTPHSLLRDFLHQHLPEYMIPSAFLVLENLPVLPNGKVDRRALASPDITSWEVGELVAPRTPVEEIVANIWANVLGVQLGIHNNFFELGGHSLLATQLFSRLRETLNVELPLRELFEFPTVAQLAVRIEKARQNQQQLPQIPPLVPVARDRDLPLSFAQKRLWFLDQFEPGSFAYNMPGGVRLTGTLNMEALEHSFNEIIQRHENLRTTFITVNGEPVQVIAPTSSFSLSVVNLQHLSPQTQQEQVEELLVSEARKPFELSVGPLLRATVLVLDDQEHILLLTMHHIISDGWSTGVFIRELAALYEAYSQGQASPLPEWPIQYADFAHWQRQWLVGDVLQAQLDYWKQQLANAPSLLELPTDRPRPRVQTFHGASQSFVVPETLSQQLKTLSQRFGVTLFMTLLAAFQTLLYRYTGTEDMCVGTPIANRNHSQTEGLIGFFVNTLVMRTQLSGNPSFSQFLQTVREVALGAYAHQDLPFEQLVEALQPERSLSHHPLFQVMFILQNAPMPAMELAGLSLTPLETSSTTAKFDLTLSMEDTPEGLLGVLEYNTDLFEAQTIDRILANFQTLLSGIVAHPQQRLLDLPLLTQGQRQQLLLEWNQTQQDYPQHECIHRLFEAQVVKTPDAVAVVFGQEELTYTELNSRANKWAHHLMSMGVGPDTLVGVCVERSLNMIIGLLAILKAGGAYVPLDPAYPTQRLSFTLEDAQVKVLLTQQQFVDKLGDFTGTIVDLDRQSVASQSLDNPKVKVDPLNLAYVIYTSGSTGVPKGVAIAHRNTVALINWASQVFSQQDIAGVLAATSICFDLSVFELFVPLCWGGKVILCENALSLPQLRAANQVKLINTVPSAMAELVRLQAVPSSVQTVNLAGEPLPLKLVEQIYQIPTVQRVLNLYGPSEDTTYSTWGMMQKHHNQTPTIGRPVGNTQVYVLDEQLQPVPVGVVGQLYISGHGLARGYINRPQLSAEKFIPDPFSKQEGSRLYKTGDLARYKEDGNIEFLGRLDHQVKIRGFRIEIGEIETILATHPAVQDTVVIPREDIPGNKRLVAYVVANQTPAPSSTQLQQFLKQQLPDYMVPSVIMLLEALPLTPNGKIDRRALPAPDITTLVDLEAYVVAQTPIEETLSQIWCEVLGLEKVGIHDNFFELGGDSILSIQIVAKANQAGLVVSAKQLFEHQTIAQLATVVGTTGVFAAQQGLVSGDVLLTPIQHWFFAQQHSQPHHWNQSILLSVRQPLEPLLLEQIVQQLLLHHDGLRLRFVHQDSHWQQVCHHTENAVVLTQADLSTLPPTQQSFAITEFAAQLQASLNIHTGPLMRVALFDLGPDQPQRLLWIIHHLAVDGVSWRILLEDLQTAYHQLLSGQAISLPPKTTSFQDWASELHNHAQSPQLLSQVDYWLNHSQSFIAPLPVDHITGDNTELSANRVSVSLSAEHTQALLQEVPKAYHTKILDILLTALVQNLSKWTTSRSILIDLEGHGREEIISGIDLSRTVGWFTSMYPVLLELKQPNNPELAIKSIKEQLRCIPDKGIGYGLLRYLNPDPDIQEKFTALPQPQVSFNYLGQMDTVVSSDALFAPAPESTGSEHSLLSRRSHLLEITGYVVGGCLQLNWIYSQNRHQPSTIENLANNFVNALQVLISHCQSSNAGGYTPSDFPLAGLNEAKLSKLANLINKSK